MSKNTEIIEQVLIFLDSDTPSKNISEYLSNKLQAKNK